jgi:hypothetical protein
MAREVPEGEAQQQRGVPNGGVLHPLFRGVGDILLTGLSTIEVVGLSLAFVAVAAFLWMSGAVEPESLVTDPVFRSAWIIAALALIRPLTWVPYLLVFGAFRKLTGLIAEDRRDTVLGAVAHALTISAFIGGLWLLTLVVDGIVTALLSGLALLTGSGSLARLGRFRGDWNAARVAGVAAIFLIVRVVLPPLDRDLGRSREPLLWFPGGARGRIDRIGLLVVLGASATLVLAGALLGRAS